MKIMGAIVDGVKRFGPPQVPLLAVFAMPDAPPAGAPTEMAAYVLRPAKVTKRGLFERYRRENPSAHVVVIADAQHAVCKSNPDQVQRDMESFLAGRQRYKAGVPERSVRFWRKADIPTSAPPALPRT
jgi:hypothetical protein